MDIRRKAITGLLLAVFALPFSVHARGADLLEYKSDHFIVFYDKTVPDSYVRDFTRKCERYYDLITERLGFNRFNFWLWENRARLYVFKDKADYIKETGAPEWTGAAVHSGTKEIASYYMPEAENEDSRVFFDQILPHELTHIIFREFIGEQTPVPLWFNEGTAVSSEKDSPARYKAICRELLKAGRLPTVGDLDKMTYATMTPEVFYPEAATLVTYLLEKKGTRRDFVELCRELRDGTGFYAAMRKVYKIEGVNDLNRGFAEYLKGEEGGNAISP